MTIAQFFVYRRPIAWTALVATLLWGVYAYLSMPQRHDPDITVGTAVVVTPYPGARAEKVEQELTRKIEKKVSENPAVERVHSISRQGSVGRVRGTPRRDSSRPTRSGRILQTKLQSMTDLPRVDDLPLVAATEQGFRRHGRRDADDQQSARVGFRDRAARREYPRGAGRGPGSPAAEYRDNRVTAVLVYPNTVARSYVLWIGNNLKERLLAKGLAEDAVTVEPFSTGCLDFHMPAGRTRGRRAARSCWPGNATRSVPGMAHPDIWPGVLIQDLDELPAVLRRNPHQPDRTVDRYSYRELRQFADLIQDRLKQSPNIGKVEQLGVQEEAVYLYYSGRRFSAFGLSPEAVVERLRQRNINLPGGRVELPDQNLVVQPSGEFRTEQEIGAGGDGRPERLSRVPAGPGRHRPRLRGSAERHEFPHESRSMRTASAHRAPARRPAARRRSPTKANAGRALPVDYRLQTTRAITLAIRQVKGVQISEFGRDIDQAPGLACARVLPDDLRIERTSDEPAIIREKIGDFNRNLIEAVVIVIIVALLFMEWRSALLVACSDSADRRHDAGHVSPGGRGPAAGVDRRLDHRLGAAGGRSGRGRATRSIASWRTASRATWPPGWARRNSPARSCSPR